MFNFRKWWFGFAFFLALLVTVAGQQIPASAQSKLKDVQGHWAQPCIEQLSQKRVINGYPDGSFKPDAPVNRAEFAAMVDTVFHNATAIRTGSEFVDVPANHWAARAIGSAYKTGFLSGYPGQIFKPAENITRVQALVALASGLKYAPTRSASDTLQAAFSDAAAIPDYAKTALASATEKQLVVNYPDVKKLNPNQLASRADVAGFLCQALGISGGVPSQYIAQAGKPIPATPTGGGSINRNGEIRGVWLTNIDSEVLFSRANLSKAVQRLAQLNFNTIYPVVWNWGYTLYPSKVAEKATGSSMRLVTPLEASVDPSWEVEKRDMLKEVIELGHQKKLTVMPWFEFGFMAPADSELAKRHPDWLTSRRDGSKTWKEGIHQRVWLNPFHPEVQKFIIDLVAEIVTNYDVDGIQFDDHFGLPNEFGYDAYTVEMYKKEIGQDPSTDPKETFWVRWRADKINDFMGRVFQAVKARKPNCIVSVSPNPLHYALPAHLQDWFTWERKGFVEEIVVQVYRNELDRFIAELDREEIQLANTHVPVGIGILTGLKGRAIPLEQIQAQVKAVRERRLAGVSFFFYESLSSWAKEKPAQREAAFKRLFRTPVQRPSMVGSGKPAA
ncbi:MAG: family 10 glycosylhydrolase [Microcoleus vaginatus WJT46-NPBG5]|jgi:uncharacterized lipoprotein YddW (UPF0748 family)|nr:family 10 glycosylhydrolase [Microcoleus vaginatus WJT46-NPBG5]